jgi:hypothetical protein
MLAASLRKISLGEESGYQPSTAFPPHNSTLDSAQHRSTNRRKLRAAAFFLGEHLCHVKSAREHVHDSREIFRKSIELSLRNNLCTPQQQLCMTTGRNDSLLNKLRDWLARAIPVSHANTIGWRSHHKN